MISFFNKLGNTWIAKVIFIVLLISMTAFWGLGGISNTSNSDRTAIQVGSQKISVTALAQAFDTERAQLGQLTGQYISPAQAIELGLLQKTIQNQVMTLVNDQIQADLGLAASDDAVRKYVERHPAFQDSLGNFDRNLFLAYLNHTHTTEAQLAEQLRDELANQHLSKTLRFVAPAPKMLAQLKWQKQNEVRGIEALLIKQDEIAIDRTPTEEELKEYYEDYISDLMQPETRDVDVVLLTPDQIAQNIQIPQEQLDAVYEEQKDTYSIPEKRHIYQIRLDSKEKAEALKPELTAQNFMAKAMANGQTVQETDFGVVSRAEILPELAEKAFAASNKTIVGPLETSVGWHLILVDSIQPATNPNKTKIYADLKQKLAAALAYDKLEETARALEDLLGEGQSLQAAAKQLKLSITPLKGIDITGTTLPQKFQNQELLQDVFLLKENEATALIDHNNGFVLAEVRQIHPAEPKSFASVKNDLKTLWRTEQQKAALPELSEKALEQMKAGSIPAKLGHTIVVHKLSTKGDAQVPDAALPQLFAQATGYENAQIISVPEGSLISVIKRIQKPVIQNTVEIEQAEALAEEISQELYNAIVAAYADKLNIQINTNLIQEAFAVYQTEQ